MPSHPQEEAPRFGDHIQRAFNAVASGDDRGLKELEQNPCQWVSPHAELPSAPQYTLLEYAILRGNVDAVALLSQRAEMPLLLQGRFDQLCPSGDLQRRRLMQALLFGLRDMQEPFAIGSRTTALMDAAMRGLVRTLCVLVLRRGALVDFQDGYGLTALALALEGNKREAADALVLKCSARITFPVFVSVQVYHDVYGRRFPLSSMQQRYDATLHMKRELTSLQQRVEEARLSEVFALSGLGSSSSIIRFG